MDFAFTEEQETIAKLARDLFERRASPEHLTELETGDIRYDAALWKELAAVDLLGTALPESVGGNGGGFVELGVLLAEVGWSVAPVPAYATLVLGADPIARHGNPEQQQRILPGVVSGERILTAGLAEPGRSDPTLSSCHPATTARRDGAGWRLDGAKELVPAAQLADTILIPATIADGGVGIFLLAADSSGVEIRPAKTTNSEPHADVFLDGATVSDEDRLPDARIEELHTRALVGLCAIQLGVAERALRTAAAYTTQREQFGRPIGSFQAVQQRLADAFIDVEAIRWTTWHAAWLIAHGRPADRAARIAKFWAAEAGARVAASAQHVHGGIGIDTTYPLHRYFLWAKHNELALGSASQQLARLGKAYARGLSMTTTKTPSTRTTTLKWTGIEVGDEVTPLEIPITTTMIVAGAIASRDFMPVHHDRDYANKQGSPNLFMNILTTNGYCVRFLTDWAGPEAMVKNLSIRLGVPCFPDDPLRFTGSVTSKTDGSGGENFVEVTFKGSNSLGDHVSGTAILSLLDGPGA